MVYIHMSTCAFQAFARGAGTQVMFKKQDSAIKSRGIMNEVSLMHYIPLMLYVANLHPTLSAWILNNQPKGAETMY